MKKFSILFIAFFIFHSAQAQEVKRWTLTECVEYAFENNLQIKQQNLSLNYSKNALRQSKLALAPSVNASASQSFSFGRSIDPYTNQFSQENVSSNQMGVSASVSLFEGFRKMNTIKQNQLNLQIGLKDLEKAKNDIALQIATAYLNILFNKEFLQITENQLNTTKEQIKKTKIQVEVGKLTQGSLLEIQAQLASEELNVINAKNNLQLSLLNLVQMLDLKEVEGFDIVLPEIPEPNRSQIPLSTQEIYANAMNLPQIESAKLNLESSKKALAISKSGLYPSLSLSASIGTGYSDARFKLTNPQMVSREIGYTESNEKVYASSFSYTQGNYSFADQIVDNQSKTISFSLRIPIFNGWQVRRSISDAKIGILRSQNQLAITQNALYKEIQQAYNDAQASFSKYEASKKAELALTESFRYTQQKFDVGLLNTVDYQIAKNQLLKAKSDLLQAKFEFVFKLKILDFYNGVSISL